MQRGVLVGVAVAALLGAAGSVRAQEFSAGGANVEALPREGLFTRDRNVSVRERPRPGYAATPIPLGGFSLSPTLEVDTEYNDNIYATETGTTSDAIFHIQPAAALVSHWSRHLLSAFARASFNEYASHGTEDTIDWTVGSAGRLDIHRDLGMAAGADYSRQTEPRTSSNSPQNIKSPIQFYEADLFVEGAKAFNRLRLSARGDLRDLDYDNGQTPTGVTVYQADRDNTALSATFKGEYALGPTTSVFANLVANTRDFRNRLFAEPKRDSSGVEATVGANFDLSHLVRGEIYVGYLRQTFSDLAFKDIGSVSARGVLEYFPTQLTTITVTGIRFVQDSGIVGAGAYLSSNLSIQVDHELLRNVVLTGKLNYGHDDYTGVDRTDDRIGAGASATYLLNRAVGLSLSYTHYRQDSSGLAQGPTFDDNRVLGSIVYQF